MESLNIDATKIQGADLKRIYNFIDLEIDRKAKMSFKEALHSQGNKISPYGPSCLSNYNKIKSDFNLERYLTWIKTPVARALLTKLRIGCNNLLYESHRFKSKESNICKVCKMQKLENVKHFLPECTAYKSIRLHYFDKISKISSSFHTLHEEDKLIFILQPQTAEISQITSSFIVNLQNERNMRLNNS